jgi:hypothetical protein
MVHSTYTYTVDFIFCHHALPRVLRCRRVLFSPIPLGHTRLSRCGHRHSLLLRSSLDLIVHRSSVGLGILGIRRIVVLVGKTQGTCCCSP